MATAITTRRISKSLVVNGSMLVSQSDWNAELETKHERLVEWIRVQHLGGVLIRRNENVAWLTGGAVELRVLTPAETGVQAACNIMKRLDSGGRRNDGRRRIPDPAKGNELCGTL